MLVNTGAGINQGGPDSVLCGTCGDDDALLQTSALVDTPYVTGVPLGGIGAGWFDLAPDGGVSRVAINNWHQNGVVWGANPGGAANGTFMAVWRRSGGAAHLLQRRPSIASPLLQAAPHASASPAFPTINVTLTPPAGANPAPVVTRGWSPFVPHQVANSYLPIAVLEVTVDNSLGTEDDDVSCLLAGRHRAAAFRCQYDSAGPLLPVAVPLACSWRMWLGDQRPHEYDVTGRH